MTEIELKENIFYMLMKMFPEKHPVQTAVEAYTSPTLVRQFFFDHITASTINGYEESIASYSINNCLKTKDEKTKNMWQKYLKGTSYICESTEEITERQNNHWQGVINAGGGGDDIGLVFLNRYEKLIFKRAVECKKFEDRIVQDSYWNSNPIASQKLLISLYELDKKQKHNN